MDASGKVVVYIALIGNPAIEVAGLCVLHNRVIDMFHEFITYFNNTSESYLTEAEPTTDSFGTRFQHALSEHELDYWGRPFYQVQQIVERFLKTHTAIQNTIIVNDFHKYKDLVQTHFDAIIQCSPTTTTTTSTKRHALFLQGKQCRAHRSLYYQLSQEPMCALHCVATMAAPPN